MRVVIPPPSWCGRPLYHTEKDKSLGIPVAVGSAPKTFQVLVLGWARIGLIFTRSQEKTQPGLLVQTGQTNRVFDTMWHHAWF